MVRLLIVRTTIAVLKQTIATSQRLRPRTWICLAVILALLAYQCFLDYQQAQPHVVLAQEKRGEQFNYSYCDTTNVTTGMETKDVNTRRATARKRKKHDARTVSIRKAYFIGQTLRELRPVQRKELRSKLESLLTSPGHKFSTAAGKYQMVYYRNWRSLYGLLYLEDVSASSQGSDLMGEQFRRWIPQHQPTFVSLPSAPGSTSLLEALQRLVLLFQAIVFTIGSIFASALGVVGYLRGKADLKLKRLQIREMELKLERMERERAIEEAAQIKVILASS